MQRIIDQVSETLVDAGSSFSRDKITAYQKAIAAETNERARWALEQILANAYSSALARGPLCDDTGIPHLILEVGDARQVSGELLEAIQHGVREGLKKLPGRPMAVCGSDEQRLDQSGGLSEDPADLVSAPIMIKPVPDRDTLRLTILMQGGGPEIRAKTFRVFHRHSVKVITDEIVDWACDSVRLLGCTPSTIAVGIGRTHYEASTFMLEAMATGDYSRQSALEQSITRRINEAQVGPLGLGGQVTALGTFVRVGPQRASGVRIVCMRPCCCFEPRRASVDL